MSPLVFGVCPNPKAVAAINTSEGMDLPGSEGVEQAKCKSFLPACPLCRLPPEGCGHLKMGLPPQRSQSKKKKKKFPHGNAQLLGFQLTADVAITLIKKVPSRIPEACLLVSSTSSQDDNQNDPSQWNSFLKS